MSDAQTLVDTTIKDHVLTATINRPKVLNALNEQVIEELYEALEEAINQSCRAMVITGAGDKAFVAGADIAAMSDLQPDQAMAFAHLGQGLTLALESSPLVTIAKVQGFALGGGCEIAMACDILLASEKALFGQPDVDLGLIPGFGGTQRLVERVGRPLAMAILVGGQKLNGQEAYNCGLASQVVAPEELDAALEKILKNIRKAAPMATSETKKLARLSREVPMSAGLEAEALAFANCFAREEGREGTQAFLEKRRASFSV